MSLAKNASFEQPGQRKSLTIERNIEELQEAVKTANEMILAMQTMLNEANQTISKLNSEKANASHTHDERYYTEAEMNAKLNELIKQTYGQVGGVGTGGWMEYWVDISWCGFTKIPHISVFEVTRTATENIWVGNISTTGFTVGIYAPSTAWNYQVWWMAIGM